MESDSSSVVGANLLKLLSVKDVFLRIKKEFRNNFLKQHLQHTASAAFQQIIKDFSFRNKAPGFNASTLQNFARRHFFDVNGVSIEIS